MKKIQLEGKHAPKPLGPYSTAVQVGNVLYIAGQIGIDPNNGEFAGADIGAQTTQIFNNIRAVVDELNVTLDNIFKLNVYLVDISNIDTVNKITTDILSEPYPARATVEVKSLPRGALVEIEACVELNQPRN